MLCSNCTPYPPSQRRRFATAREREPGMIHLLPLLCSSCGAAVTPVTLQDRLAAKVRQLELFGLGLKIYPPRSQGLVISAEPDKTEP